MAILEDPLYLTGVLERLDLEKYREVFEKHEINYDAFKLLKEENLNQLNIPVGPKVIILNEIERIKRQKSEGMSTQLKQHKSGLIEIHTNYIFISIDDI